VLAHPPYSPDLAPCDYWLFSCVKEHIRGKWFDSEDDINTAVIASFARTNTELQLIVYHIDRKSVGTVLAITLSKGHVYFCHNKIIHKTSEMAHVFKGRGFGS
jgi:hypothetical protein